MGLSWHPPREWGHEFALKAVRARGPIKDMGYLALPKKGKAEAAGRGNWPQLNEALADLQLAADSATDAN